MTLAAYLGRVGHRGPLAPTLETLVGLHRAHLLAIPYENLDIHLGRRLELDEARIFDKLVARRRGGWCFEMNALFASVLEELGFAPRLLAGAVNREGRGDATRLTHLVLLVQLERPYLVDVGFGNGFLEPLPLTEGAHRQGFLRYELQKLDETWWRYRQFHGGPSFDFTLEPCRLTDFADVCRTLQTSPESGFVQFTVCHRFLGDAVLSLRGATLRRVAATETRAATLTTPAAYARALQEGFGLALEPEDLATLWPKVRAQHRAWLAAQRERGSVRHEP